MIFDAKVIANEEIAPDIWVIRFTTESDLSDFRAGAFLHIRVDDGPYPLFRRAFSILAAKPGEAEVLYKTAGIGSRLLSKRRPGEWISMIGPLGNTFRLPDAGTHAILVAGGVGMPPIYRWAQNLLAAGVAAARITFIYGARNASELVLRDRVEALGVEVRYATDDGSYGHHGLVTDIVLEAVETQRAAGAAMRFYACGPGPMLAALTRIGHETAMPGELSLETPMPCAVGVCLGCVVPCRADDNHIEYRRTCVDGPILDAREVVWPSD